MLRKEQGDKKGDQKLEAKLAASITLATAKALKYAHNKGVIHRDIKPANILVSKDTNSVKVLDFGLAKLRSTNVNAEAQLEGSHSQTGGVLGTPQYMAPEQAEGKVTDARADIYSLGITLYELVTGKLPFEGDSVFSIMEGHIRKVLEFPSGAFEDVPPLFTELISGMCEKKPDDRLSLKHIIEKLEAFLGISHATIVTDSEASTTGSRTNLQERSTSFVGRTKEMQAIADLISQPKVKLVTIVGPGGVGKTRITQEYGLTQAATPDYPGGVWFCDLTEARSVDGICYAVSQGIGVPLTQADSLAQIEAILSMRENCLMIFDNFEQVVEHAAETLGRWMAKAPKVKFITSSREPLHLEGERPFPLQPLSSSRERGSPDPQIGPEGREGEEKDADVDIRAPDQEHPPAIQLFIDRASVAKRGFKVDEASLSAIAQIVDQLDGIPLAIELAASRCSAIKPQQILERMPRRFDLLKGRRKDASARQATLRGAIDWSWNLLEDYEKSALAQCSVFQNGFFLEAAEAVIDLEAFDDAPFEMDVVEALVEKSLLVSFDVPSIPGEARYRMLESIRQYAGEKLEEVSVDTNDLLLRHAEYFVEYAEEWDEAIVSPDAVEALDRVELELENLIGIQKTLEREEPILSSRAIQLCATTLRIRGPWNERIGRLQRALDALSRDPEPDEGHGQDLLYLQLKLAIALTRAQFDCGGKEGLEQAGEQVQELETNLEGDSDEVSALRLSAAQARCSHLVRTGQIKAAAELLDNALEAHPNAGKDCHASLMRAYAAVVGNRGIVHDVFGEYDHALECYAEAEAICRELGNQSGVAASVGNCGVVHQNLGEYDQALACYAEAVAIARELGHQSVVASIVGNRGVVHANLGEYDQALACYAEAEAIARELGNKSLVASNVGNRGSILRILGRLDDAWAAQGESESIARRIGLKQHLPYCLIGKSLICIDLSDNQEKAWQAAPTMHDALTFAQEALQLCKELGTQKTELYFATLATFAVIEERLGETGTSAEANDFGLAMTAEELLTAAKEHAEQAKALGEELKFDRHEKYGPKKGEFTEYWQYVDECLNEG